MNRERNDRGAGSSRDALAELIRRTGRRQPPPADAYASVRSAAFAAWQDKLRARRNRRLSLAAASIATVLGFAALLPLLLDSGSTTVATVARTNGGVYTGRSPDLQAAAVGIALASGQRLSTTADGGAALVLAGRVSLRVAGDTTVEIDAADAVNLVAGTVYVDSNDAAEAVPLAITTVRGTVTDIGTQFEVRQAGDTLRVRVRSGLVRLSRPGVVAADVDGTAGDEFEVFADGSVERGNIAPADSAWRWAEALAVPPASGFGSIHDCLDWIARETGRAIRFDTPSTEIQAELRDLGGNPPAMPPLELLELIGRVSDFEYDVLADGSILISRK